MDDMYSRYNDNYDPSMRYGDGYEPPVPTRLKPYHMKGRILTYLSFPLGLATVAMVLMAFVGPIEATLSANLIFLAIATGFVGLLFGLVGKIRGRKELDLARWPSSFGMLFAFLGLLVSSMVVFASYQTYSNYGEMLAKEQEAEEQEKETVTSVMTDDGEIRDMTDMEKKQVEKEGQKVAKEEKDAKTAEPGSSSGGVQNVGQGSARDFSE